MRKFLATIAALIIYAFAASPALAVECNSPSGFIKSFGTFSTGDLPVFGPDCEHIAAAAANGGRTFVSAPITYFVNPSAAVAATCGAFTCQPGSDFNNGLSIASPFQTIQKAINTIADTLILAEALVTVQVANNAAIAGTCPILKPYVGSFLYQSTQPIIVGDNTTPANVTLTCATGGGFSAFSVNTPWTIKGFKFAPTSPQPAIFADWNANINLGNIECGASTTICVVSRYHSQIEFLSGSNNIRVTANMQAFAQSVGCGIILGQGAPGNETLVLVGVPAFTSSFVIINDPCSQIDLQAFTYTGTATGQRYGNTNGGSFLPTGTGVPGNAAGQYCNSYPGATSGTGFICNRDSNNGVSISGTTGVDNAIAGNVGEYVECVVLSGAAVAFVNATDKTICSLTLSAGDWDVSAIAYFTGNVATTVTVIGASISLVDNTLDTTPGRYHVIYGGGATMFNNGFTAVSGAIPVVRIVTAGVTVRVIGYCQFGVNTCSGFGTGHARRVR